MKKVSFRQRLSYWFDNTMAAGTPALIGWLAVVTLASILVIATLIFLLNSAPASEDGSQPTYAALLWSGLRHSLDPGAIIDEQDAGPAFLLPMLVLTVAGIFILSTLIGILTSGFESKIDELRRGRSAVLENGHTLILGWSDAVFTIIPELVSANASQRQPRIVILAPKDKVEMEDEISSKVPDTGKTKVICRTGSPIDLADLEIANPQGARAIIVLSPGGEEPDAEVIKTILAITNNPRRRPEPYHIAAEIRSRKNMEAARLVGGTEAQVIEVGDTISRLIAQTSRQSGLSVVYNELLDFEGDEIYFKDEPSLIGQTFGEATLAYENSTLIGMFHKDGKVQLNPPMSTTIAAGDQMIVISSDDSAIKVSGLTDHQINTTAILERPTLERPPERILILGWNRRARIIINELNNYVPAGSSITVVAEEEAGAAEAIAGFPTLPNVTVRYLAGDTTDRATLEELQLGDYKHIIVLSYSDTLDVQRADARTLITLLHLRDFEQKGGESFSIVSEMLDDRNRTLAQVTEADDFIVSDKLISLMLAQIAENKHLRDVFADLFDPSGSEIYLKPASEYVQPGTAVNFYTVVEAARRCGEVALGYKRQADSRSAEKTYGVVVNPNKAQPITFAEADRVIVLAES